MGDNVKKYDDEYFMKEALKEAYKAYNKNEVPIGCVIVKDKEIIARAHNIKEQKNDSTSHAEILAIKKASKKLGKWRLNDCSLYVTLEPCPMCAGAMLQSRIDKLIFGTMDDKAGAIGSKLNLLKDYKFNHKIDVCPGVLGNKCQEILQKFFKELRNKL